LLGLAASLVGVAVWILFYVALDLISGWAAALSVILFFFVYKKFNAGKISKDLYLIIGIAVVIEIVLAELISLLIIAGQNGLDFATVMGMSEVQTAVLRDVLIGLLFAGIYFYFTISDERRREKLKAAQEAKVQESLVDAGTLQEVEPETVEDAPEKDIEAE
ncbi:MAG: hypothetical protein LBM99_00685, partial [Bacillales bacterium]|nr:hypothetical protein [Bacillales bacterium]